MKYAYTVKGSEDGLMGVYTSMRRAEQEAINYVAQAGEDLESDTYGNITEYVNGWLQAEVQKWRVA